MIPGLGGALLGSFVGLFIAYNLERKMIFRPKVCDAIMYACVFCGILIDIM